MAVIAQVTQNDLVVAAMEVAGRTVAENVAKGDHTWSPDAISDQVVPVTRKIIEKIGSSN